MARGRFKMAKRTNYQGKRGTVSFIMLRHDMMDSEAWKALSPESQALWLHVRRRYNGNNNGDIPLSCREAAQLLNVSKNTAAKSFQQLENSGFIRLGQHSDFRLKTKRSRRWIMTHECNNGHGPTNEWRAWRRPVSEVEQNG
jgi:hypothetical protein